MGYCVGSGRPEDGDHCCYVEGTPCPHVMTNAQIVAWIDAQGWGATKRQAALTFVQGIVWTCRIALNILADNPNLRNNRKNFETAWDTHPDYLAVPAPVWRRIETDNGFPAGTLECSRWQGDPPGLSCCFTRSMAESDAYAANHGMHTNAVTVRKAGGRPD